jgi:membrane protein required for colicin V production
VWASARFSAVVSTWAAQYISVSDQALKIISFALILVAVFIILGLIGKLLEGVFQLVMLGWLNRLLGVVFALLKAFVIIGILILVFNSLNDTFNIVKPSVMSDSVLYPYISKAANEIFPYIKDILKK